MNSSVGSLDALFSLLLGVISQTLAMARKEEQGHLESAVQRVIGCVVAYRKDD